MTKNRKWIIAALAIVVLGFLGWRYWQQQKAGELPAGIAAGNGRIEARLADVSAKEPLRVKEVRVQEGDLVKPGQVVALLDTLTLEAYVIRCTTPGKPMHAASQPVVSVQAVSHLYGKVKGLDAISIDIPSGIMVGIIGPDGVGKSTLLGLMAGAKKLQQGSMTVLAGDIGDIRHCRSACPRMSMPQWLQTATYFLPARHFVSFSQVIIYRGGGLWAVWEEFAMVAIVGLAFFVYSLALFRKSIAVTK